MPKLYLCDFHNPVLFFAINICELKYLAIVYYSHPRGSTSPYFTSLNVYNVPQWTTYSKKHIIVVWYQMRYPYNVTEVPRNISLQYKSFYLINFENNVFFSRFKMKIVWLMNMIKLQSMIHQRLDLIYYPDWVPFLH